MAIENEKIVHECFPKHFRMVTARLIEYKETEEEDKKKRVKIERSKVDMK